MSLEPSGLITLAIIVFYVLGGQAVITRRASRERRALEAVGARLGVAEIAVASGGRVSGWMGLRPDGDVRKLRAELDGVPISVSCFRADSVTSRDRITRCTAGGVTRTVVIRPRGGLAALGETLAGRTFRTGDDVFDAEVTCEGDELMLVAALDAGARARLVALFVAEPDALVQDGEVRVDQAGIPDAPERVEALLRRLVGVAAAMPTEGVGIRARVERIVEGDPVPEVRARALTVLHRRLPGAETDVFLRHALGSSCLEVRRVAATLLQDGPTLEALVGDSALPWVERAALIEVLAGLREDGLDNARRARLAPLEGAFIGALGDPDANVRAAAATALGWLGTLSAVEALRAHSRERLGFAKVASEAENAIRMIHTRLESEGGRLALAGVGGEVAVATEGGSIAVEEADGRPLPKAVRAG